MKLAYDSATGQRSLPQGFQYRSVKQFPMRNRKPLYPGGVVDCGIGINQKVDILSGYHVGQISLQLDQCQAPGVILQIQQLCEQILDLPN